MVKYEVKNDLWGNKVILDYRPVAGGSACKSGKLFEDVVANTFHKAELTFDKKPKFKCIYDLPRQGDFLVNINENVIHIECKQLGNAESHFDKLSHCFLNMLHGCYGKNFWLVYDYNRQGKKNTIKKIDCLRKTAETFKKQARLAGISFELVDIKELQNTIYKYKFLS